MLVQTHSFCPSICLPKTLAFPRSPFAVCRLNPLLRRLKYNSAIRSSSTGQDSSEDVARKRKIVEHICLLKAKDLDEEKENIMLDYLYTSQYQMGGMVAVSLGRISDQNPEDYTHAFYTRFQRREDLEKFYENSFYLGVLKNYVMPYCHVRADMG